MATIKKFNSENFNVNVVDAMNFQEYKCRRIFDLKVEVTDKETGIKVYDTVLERRLAPIWDATDDWYDFIVGKIEDGADLDEDLDYWDADEELKKEFDDMIEEQYIDWVLESIKEGHVCDIYTLDDEDLAEIFDDDYSLVIIDGENVWFTDPRQWNMIGYNIDTENEVYECDEYIIEDISWHEYVLREKNDIKIIEDLFEEAA